MQPIYLIGFMCTGKTTLGVALSVRLGIDFIDLDHYIEQKAGKTVKEIFADEGEACFRNMEIEALKEISARTDVIVACGGGTPCQKGAMEIMNTTGTTIRLEPSERRLLRRMLSGRNKRPLIADISTAEDMHDFMIFTKAQREPYYSKAKYRFDTTRLESQQEVEETVNDFIEKFIRQ